MSLILLQILQERKEAHLDLNALKLELSSVSHTNIHNNCMIDGWYDNAKTGLKLWKSCFCTIFHNTLSIFARIKAAFFFNVWNSLPNYGACCGHLFVHSKRYYGKYSLMVLCVLLFMLSGLIIGCILMLIILLTIAIIIFGAGLWQSGRRKRIIQRHMKYLEPVHSFRFCTA